MIILCHKIKYRYSYFILLHKTINNLKTFLGKRLIYTYDIMNHNLSSTNKDLFLSNKGTGIISKIIIEATLFKNLKNITKCVFWTV
jgi:hypothetical protein